MRKISMLFFPALLFLEIAVAQFVYVAPVAGSKFHSPNRTIILRSADYFDPSSFEGKKWYSVSGSYSGEHRMKAQLAKDEKTLILTPIQPFTSNEIISVVIDNSLKNKSGGMIKGIAFTFQIQPQYSLEEITQLKAAKEKLMEEDFGSVRNIPQVVRNEDNFPKFEIDVNTNPAPGDIFYYSFNFEGAPNKFICIMSSNGDSVYSQQTAEKGSTFDINKNGYITVFNYDSSCFEVWDSAFNIINTYTAQGYTTDPHDFVLLPNGHSFLLAYDPQVVDMTIYYSGYKPDAIVTGAILQELDSDKNLIFEWRSWDHVEITEAQHIYLSVSFIDYIHPNSIEIDSDSNLLVSCRVLEQVLKINRITGEVMWRMGGTKNEFAFLNDPKKFSFQHDCRRLANGNISIFDNGCYHTPPVASFKEYKVDEQNKTATLVFSFQHPLINGENLESWAMGNAQRLSNGNTFINWGYRPTGSEGPNMTEIDSLGNIVWEMHFNDILQVVAYRAHRYEWDPCVATVVDSVNTFIVSDSTAIVSWAPVRGAGSYLIQYKPILANYWDSISISADTTTFLLQHLIPSTTYSWMIQALCTKSSTASTVTAVQNFTMPPLSNDTLLKEMDVTIFPNPASNLFYCLVKQKELEDVHLALLDIFGRERYRITVKANESNQLIVIPTTDFSSGFYFLKITAGSNDELLMVVLE